MKLRLLGIAETAIKLTPWEDNLVFNSIGLHGSPSSQLPIERGDVESLISACWHWKDEGNTRDEMHRLFGLVGRLQGLQRREAHRKDKLMDKLHTLLGTAETWDAAWPIQRKASYLQRILRQMVWIHHVGICIERQSIDMASSHYSFPACNYKVFTGANWADEAMAWLTTEGNV